jgi:predicted DNA-binding transcriptional regulator AlpA
MTRLLSVSEVAEWLGVSAAWVRDHACGRRQPKLVGIKLGTDDGKGLWKFLESDVNAFIENQRQA